MNIKPILSICIPTFQRKDALERTIQKIIESEKLVKGKIEICISDNGSTDGTFKMLKSYSKKYSFIKIRRNRKNTGFDSNLVSIFKMAKGKYYWGIGDDDTIFPEGVKTLVILLSGKKQFTMGLTGAMAYKRDIILIEKYFKKQEYANNEFIIHLISAIHNSSKLSKSHQDITILGFLPCYFFSKDTLKQSFKSLGDKRYGWYHLALLFHILSNFEGTLLVNKKVSLKHGQTVEHEKDSMLLPGEEFNLFITKRIEALSGITKNKKLYEAFYQWLNVRGSYFYIKSLAELCLISEMITRTEYDTLKKKVYKCQNNLEMPLFIRLGITSFRAMEHFSLFRKLIALIYSKIHYVYIEQVKAHLKGSLQTNDEREGGSSLLKR